MVTPAERRLLVARTQSNRTGRTELSSFDWAQAKEAALDIKIWLFLVIRPVLFDWVRATSRRRSAGVNHREAVRGESGIM
jgi:hypothetical protein